MSKSYDGGQRFALHALSLDIAAGSFVAVVGASGSGKTTLLKLINRLIEPSTGAVFVDGENVAGRDPVLLRRQIGYVFQGVGLFPHMTVAQNIAVTPRLLGWSKERVAARIDELLDLVRLPRELGSALPDRLSGGQAQRVGVARALAANPRIVLMDEPFGAVDQITRDALARDYRGLHDALGLTTLMITHDLSEAVLMADRIAVLEQGRLVGLGTPQELLTRPQDAYVRELIAMPQRQAKRLQQLLEGGGAG